LPFIAKSVNKLIILKALYTDITIKSYCDNFEEVEATLLSLNAVYQGLDMQTDTYYESEYGKLKHRQGNIENILIHYNRVRRGTTKQTEVLLYMKNPSADTITIVCGDKKIEAHVRKQRKIYFIGNIKFNLDSVERLGNFIEIEAIDLDGSVGVEVLQQQCDYYREKLQISDDDLVQYAYTDMLRQL
jgi:adenylate cyclase, class 2